MPLRCLSCFITFFITFRLYGVPRWQPAEKGQDSGHCYDTNSYRKAVESAIRACRQAIKDRGGDPETELPKWTPHRLRHTAATKARRLFNYETAGALLGHSNMSATAIYAERNQGLADEAARQLG